MTVLKIEAVFYSVNGKDTYPEVSEDLRSDLNEKLRMAVFELQGELFEGILFYEADLSLQ